MSYSLVLTATARRQLTEGLPEAVAVAAWEFISGPVRENPHRVGKRLLPPKAHLHAARRGTYRILYVIDDIDLIITIERIEHRRDAYR